MLAGLPVCDDEDQDLASVGAEGSAVSNALHRVPVRDVGHSQVVHLCARHGAPRFGQNCARGGPKQLLGSASLGQLAWRGEAG